MHSYPFFLIIFFTSSVLSLGAGPQTTTTVTIPAPSAGIVPAGATPPASPPTPANPSPVANGTKSNCAAASILASGIGVNIQDQMQEQAALSSYSQLLSQAAPGSIASDKFTSAKAQLLTFVNNGIAIREANQLITPPGNPATEGIAMVANAQLMELSLSSGLTGSQNDKDAVTKLEGMFKDGTDKNRQNMAMVSYLPKSTM